MPGAEDQGFVEVSSPEELASDGDPIGRHTARLFNDFHQAFWQDREQMRLPRAWYAWTLLGALAVEVVASLLALFLLGFGRMHLSRWVADVFFVAVFAQIVGLVHVILTHLFPTPPFSIPEQYRRLPRGK